MSGIELSKHAETMCSERQISHESIWQTLRSPDMMESGMDGNTHSLKRMPGLGNRVLRIVVNESVTPKQIVTI